MVPGRRLSADPRGAEPSACEPFSADAIGPSRAAVLETEREAARARQLAARLETLLATLPAGVVVVDHTGIVQQCNAAAEALLGSDVIGSTWSSLAATAFESQRTANGDSVTRDGRNVAVLSGPVANAADDRVLLLLDVTEKRALEGLVERNSRLSSMGKMAATVAHQIRTPLASALLYFSQCRRRLTDERGEEFLARGIERLHAMDRLVQDMLVFARGSGSSERVRIADLFRDVHAAVAPLLRADDRLVIDGTDTLLSIAGNRIALVAALTNLVNNAFEAAEGVVVTLKARVELGQVELVVVDNGPGIPPAIRSRVCEPFFSTRPAGTGLGLAVAKTVAEAHGGDLNVDSLPIGTTVGLTFPSRDAEAIANEPIEACA